MTYCVSQWSDIFIWCNFNVKLSSLSLLSPWSCIVNAYVGITCVGITGIIY